MCWLIAQHDPDQVLIPGGISTFLKRKGGLFKKAHELSVLCSVDVAVIIFGHNKKLYEFSSGDINETIGRHQYVRPSHLEAEYFAGIDFFIVRPSA